jgi:hypothetical protein
MPRSAGSALLTLALLAAAGCSYHAFSPPARSARAFLSQPLAARAVYLGRDDGEPRGSKPQTSFGLGADLGVRIPLQRDTKVPHAFVLGVGLTELFDRESRNGFFTAALGVDFAL